MKNSKWMLNDFMTIFVLMMILFSSPWLAAKGKLTISHVDINGDMMTLFGEFEPGPSKKSTELVVTLDGVILDFVLVSETEIEAVLPFGLEGGDPSRGGVQGEGQGVSQSGETSGRQ